MLEALNAAPPLASIAFINWRRVSLRFMYHAFLVKYIQIEDVGL
jgi:hypothetical protein